MQLSRILFVLTAWATIALAEDVNGDHEGNTDFEIVFYTEKDLQGEGTPILTGRRGNCYTIPNSDKFAHEGCSWNQMIEGPRCVLYHGEACKGYKTEKLYFSKNMDQQYRSFRCEGAANY